MPRRSLGAILEGCFHDPAEGAESRGRRHPSSPRSKEQREGEQWGVSPGRQPGTLGNNSRDRTRNDSGGTTGAWSAFSPGAPP